MENRQQHLDFASDNVSGICPQAWEAMGSASRGFAPAYGEDDCTSRACDLVRSLFECDCEVFFVFTGTAANSLALASLCQSYHSVITHEHAHIETDECGGPEFFSNGTKLLLVPDNQGKIDAEAVERRISLRTDIHYPKPKVLSITQATELGTVYTPNDLGRISQIKDRFGVKLHMDGARFANAVASLEVSPREITWNVGVDVLCLGGAKNGLPIGDCVIFFDRNLATEFSYRCKQAGQLASKMRYLSAPWLGILQDNVWLENARHANESAQRLRTKLSEIPGVNVAYPVHANAVFVEFPGDVTNRLRQEGWQFYGFIGAGVSRLMCSWRTTNEAIDELCATVKRLVNDERQLT